MTPPISLGALISLVAFGAEAFAPGVLLRSGCGLAVAPNGRRALCQRQAKSEKPKPVVLSEIDDESERIPGWKKYAGDQVGTPEPGKTYADDYSTFIDSEGFDGGDGQVGVVGEADNKMPTFDESEGVQRKVSKTRIAGAIGGTSKQVQKSRFGYTTGYADELKEKRGMVDIDEYGEDRLFARRQQLENWKTQRELKAQQVAVRQEMAGRTGTAYDSRQGSKAYMDQISGMGKKSTADDGKWMGVYKGEEKVVATAAAEGLEKGDITGEVAITCQFPKPGFARVEVENDIMPFQDFKTGFTSDSAEGGKGFTASPLSGTLNRRGGAPTEIKITYAPTGPGGAPREAWLVVEGDESKWTYHVVATVR